MPNTVQHTPAPAPTKTEFDTLAEQIVPKQVSYQIATGVTNTQYTRVSTIGSLCVCSFTMINNTSRASGDALVTGLPKPKCGAVNFIATGDTAMILGLYIDENGNLKTRYAMSATAIYGSVAYEI